MCLPQLLSAGGMAFEHARGRSDPGRGSCDFLPAEHCDNVLPALFAGRQRLYVQGGFPYGQDHAPGGPARPFLHSYAHRFRLQCARHNGGKEHRQPQGQGADHAYDSVYELLGPPAGLSALCFRLLPGLQGPGDDVYVRNRNTAVHTFRLCDEAHEVVPQGG